MTTKKSKKEFDIDMFAEQDSRAEDSKQTPKHGDAVKSTTSTKLNNHSVKEVNTTAEPRSQRKQFLFTKTTSNNMKLLANAKNISVNEMVNEVMEQYIQDQFKDNPKLAEASKLINSNQ